MKLFRYSLMVASAVLFISCKNETPVLGDFKLLPLPQEMQIDGVSDMNGNALRFYYVSDNLELPVIASVFDALSQTENSDEAQLKLTLDTTIDLPSEGYTLSVSNNQVSITGKDGAGLFYGLQTLKQLMTDAEEQGVNLPLCDIKDYPLLSYRSVHWDIKHHIEKTAYYYDMIDKLASYKINAVLVELEDKLGFVKQPKVASADALTIEEWQKLSNYAKKRNIEISPLVQGLGHASFILKHDEYQDLRDDPESDWAFNPLDEKTYEVQFDLYLDAIEATPHGKYLHVGGDEVHTTGRNSGKASLELQLDWLNKVCQFAEEQGRIPIFWDDMPLKDAGLWGSMFNKNLTEEQVDSLWKVNEPKLTRFLDKYPKNCIYMRWNYSSPEALGNEKAMAWFRDNGMSSMGATAGQTRWVLMPQNESNMDNIKSFAMSSIKNNQKGLLLTLWDDDSPHFELYNRGIIAFSEYTWSGDKRSKNEIKEAYRQREFSKASSDPALAFVDDLEGPVAFWKNALLYGNKRNYLKSSVKAIDEFVIDLPDKANKGEWSERHKDRLATAKSTVITCDSIALKIEEMKLLSKRNVFTLEVYEQVNMLVRFTAELLVELERFDLATEEEIAITSLNNLKKKRAEFNERRSALESVYSKTRNLTKPADYILDQDHHVHLANQTVNFDWQFLAELMFLGKLEATF